MDTQIQNPIPDVTSSAIPPLQPATQLEPIGDTLKESWEIFKQHFSILGTISAIVTLTVVIWTILVPTKPEAMSEQQAQAYPYIAIFAFVLIAVALMTQIMMFMFALKRDQVWTLDTLFNASTKKLFGFFGVSLLTGIPVMIGLVLFVIPGIYLAIALSFGVLIYLDQNTGAVDSLNKSRELVKGFWWPVFGRYFAFIVIVILVTIVTVLPFGAESKAGTIINALSNFVVMPVATIYSVLIYEQLKKLKSGV